MPTKSSVFISYRRSDSSAIAGRISDRLVHAFSDQAVFKDSQDIRPGDDFRGKIREGVAQADVILVIIGPAWATVTEKDDPAIRRIDNPDDWVRIEVETGLQRDSALVIPILVNNASMPNPDFLPPSLRELAFKQGKQVRDDPDFHRDMNELIDYLRTVLDVAADTSRYRNQWSLVRKMGGLVIGFLVLLFAFLALFSEEWRNDMWYKLGIYTATPSVQTTIVATSTNSGTETPPATPVETSLADCALKSQFQMIGQKGRQIPPGTNHIRSSPSEFAPSEVIGEIPPPTNNEFFTIVDGPICNEGYIWWKVDYQGVIGWTPEGGKSEGAYWTEPILALTPTPTAPTFAMENVNPEDCNVFVMQDLNLRMGPSRNYDRVTAIPAGEIAKAVARLENYSWWQITWNENRGWVSGGDPFIKVDGNCSAIVIYDEPFVPTATP